MIKTLFAAILLSLISCGETETSENSTIENISAYNTIEYLNAHPVIDTAKVQIPQSFQSLIAVKKEENKLLTNWLENYTHKEDNNILEIWQQFGNILNIITLEFKVIQLLGLNPRIVFLKKEAYYRELGLPFKPFANVSIFLILQNQLLFAQDLLQNYSEDSIEALLDKYFEKHLNYSKDDEEALRFDLMRWYILKNADILSNRQNE